MPELCNFHSIPNTIGGGSREISINSKYETDYSNSLYSSWYNNYGYYDCPNKINQFWKLMFLNIPANGRSELIYSGFCSGNNYETENITIDHTLSLKYSAINRFNINNLINICNSFKMTLNIQTNDGVYFYCDNRLGCHKLFNFDIESNNSPLQKVDNSDLFIFNLQSPEEIRVRISRINFSGSVSYRLIKLYGNDTKNVYISGKYSITNNFGNYNNISLIFIDFTNTNNIDTINIYLDITWNCSYTLSLYDENELHNSVLYGIADIPAVINCINIYIKNIDTCGFDPNSTLERLKAVVTTVNIYDWK